MSNEPSGAASDPTLERDIERVAAYATGKRGEPFTSVELVGWTNARGLVYRTAVCDPDELGGRGAYCTVEVCRLDAGATDPVCESPADVTVGDPFDAAKALAATKAAEAAQQATTRGHEESITTVELMSRNGDIGAVAQSWFGATLWTLFPTELDHDTGERYGFSNATVTSARKSDDGNCLAFAGTALRRGRYESVTGNIRFAFAGRRCLP